MVFKWVGVLCGENYAASYEPPPWPISRRSQDTYDFSRSARTPRASCSRGDAYILTTIYRATPCWGPVMVSQGCTPSTGKSHLCIEVGGLLSSQVLGASNGIPGVTPSTGKSHLCLQVETETVLRYTYIFTDTWYWPMLPAVTCNAYNTRKNCALMIRWWIEWLHISSVY